MKVSVVIPMYNAEQTIVKALTSVVSQLPKDQLEVIIINDGSTDRSSEIVEKFVLENDYDIKLIHQANKGVSAARNEGFSNAKYEIIALNDSDDVWLPDKLQEQLVVMKKYDADFVGALINHYTLGFPYKLEDEIFRISFRKLMLKMVPSTPTIIFKKKLLETTGGFDENQKFGEDGNLWLRFSKFANMIMINKTLAIAGDFKPLFGHSGLSGNMKGMFNGERKNLKDMLHLGYINKLEYFIYLSYIGIKYYRRVFLVKNR